MEIYTILLISTKQTVQLLALGGKGMKNNKQVKSL